ncbi:MAG: ribonuclease H-like domain-containing protein [Candidatus Binataceae bacterium]
MLAFTFRHLPGIGRKKEQALWESGVVSWDEFAAERALQAPLFANGGRGSAELLLQQSRRALWEGWVDFFAERLPREEHYRIALSFPSETVFLDIETTGLSRYYHDVTLVGWSVGSSYRVLIAGDDDAGLRSALSHAKVAVTFNGSLFDLPFLRRRFPYLNLPSVHVDLRFLAKRVGLTGGQKKIERKLGIKRCQSIASLEGEAAPLLWHRYRRGDIEALKLLVSYNHADIEGMKGIFDAVVARLLRRERVPLPHELPRFSEQSGRVAVSVGSPKPTNDAISLRPYRGRTGPAVTFRDLELGPRGSLLRVVGIDPTGSESRPSGWCLLEGNTALSKRLAADKEIIEATLAATPDLVSIDSPLSLPKGRVKTADDDPGRDRYGITRECERILKKRGVNVYPCLIRSMQALTARGIRLTEELRRRGVPVIESYPGAAQDILGIPRKRASLEFLKAGLAEFGLVGEFESRDVSHDELDAITSALVGVFFWAGRFEALGNHDEGYLIIPDLEVDSGAWRKRRVLGFSGPIAAGKTTAAEFLRSRGFQYGRFSAVLGEMLKEGGLEPSRNALQQLGEDVHQKPGGQRQLRQLGMRLVRMLPPSGNLAIDGLRHPEDHALLVEVFGPAFVHVHMEAPEATRLYRYVTGGGDEQRFRWASAHPVEANVPWMARLAHKRIDNSEPLESLFAAVDDIVAADNARPSGKRQCL